MLLRLKKPMAAVLAAVMLFAMCSCTGKEDGEGKSSADGYKFHWMDSNIMENVDKMGEAKITDDFAAAVNYEWTKVQTVDNSFSMSSFGEAMRKVVENKRAILNDKSVTNDKNVELVRIADGLFNDWEYRNTLGVVPLKKYLAYIDEIKTLDDVSAYMIDNEKNPFAVSFVKMSYFGNDSLDDCRALELTKPKLILDKTDEYVTMTQEGYKDWDRATRRIRYVLGRCSYSEKDIKAVINGSFRTESELVNLDYIDSVNYAQVITMDDALKRAGTYPLGEMLKHYGITKCDNIMGELKYLDKLEKFYTEKNVADMKAYFKARLVLESIRFLDKEAYDFYMDTNLDRTNKFAERIDRNPDMVFFSMLNTTALTAAVDQMYIDYYYDEAVEKEIREFLHQIKEKYKILIDENKFLSEESKKSVKEKLEKMGENVIRPSNKADFTGVTLKTKEEGGTFLDALCVLNKISHEHTGIIVQQKIPKDYWDIYNGSFSTTVTNASYDPMQNCVYIRAGILVEPMYTHDAPIEKKLGSFVAVLGHEISHAFDSKNIQYDADGKTSVAITDTELEEWDKVVEKIGNHFFDYKPFEGAPAYTDGRLISGEIIADAEGIKVALMIGKDQKDFNYDLFFRSYAGFWRFVMTKQEQMDMINKDSHPLEYLRVNYTLAQFDEFIQTYGLKPGDGMYMDPKERILIW